MEKKEIYCNCCHKKIMANDEFIVKDELWKEFCSRKGISRKSIVCISCYEQEMGKIDILKDLKTSCNETGRERELPGNFKLLIERAKKEDAQVLIPKIKQGLQKKYLDNLKKYGPTDYWVTTHKETIKRLSAIK